MNKFYKPTKYHSRRSKCWAGHNHPSMLECNYCNQLQALVKSGDIHSFDYQKSYELRVNGKLIGKHKPDFSVITNKGTVEVHETKGMETTDWNLRKNLFEAIYPEIPYIVIK